MGCGCNKTGKKVSSVNRTVSKVNTKVNEINEAANNATRVVRRIIKRRPR